MKAIPYVSVLLLLLVNVASSQEYPAYRVRSEFTLKDKTVAGNGLCVPIQVDGKKLLLTAAHVVKNDEGKNSDEILVDLPDGWIRCKIKKIDAEADLCLLEPRINPPKVVELDKKNNEQNQDVFNPNYFCSMKMKIEEGTLIIEASGGRWIAKIPEYSHGSSGSPVYTKEGKLCGLGIAGYSEDGGKTMTFAIVVGRKAISKFVHSEK